MRMQLAHCRFLFAIALLAGCYDLSLKNYPGVEAGADAGSDPLALRIARMATAATPHGPIWLECHLRRRCTAHVCAVA